MGIKIALADWQKLGKERIKQTKRPPNKSIQPTRDKLGRFLHLLVTPCG
jgi:hypothetical protein